MKKATQYLIIICFISLIFVLPVLGDQPPDPGGDPTGQPVGGSPLGGGLFILIFAGLMYGIQKLRISINK